MMSKKKKLKLDDLKVNSFVTSLADDSQAQVKGGVFTIIFFSVCSDCSECSCPSINYTDCTDCGGGGGTRPPGTLKPEPA
jgi:hypothetical protein